MDTLQRLLNKSQSQTVIARDPSSNEAAKKNSLLYSIPKDKRQEIGKKALADLPAVSRSNDGTPVIVQLSKLLDMKREPTRSWKQEERTFKVETDENEAEFDLYHASKEQTHETPLSKTPFDSLSARLASVSLEQQNGKWSSELEVGYSLDDSGSSVTDSASDTTSPSSSAVHQVQALASIEAPEASYSLLCTSTWEEGIQWDDDSSQDDQDSVGPEESVIEDSSNTEQPQNHTNSAAAAGPSVAKSNPVPPPADPLQAPKLERAQSYNLEDMDVEWEDDQQTAQVVKQSSEAGKDTAEEEQNDVPGGSFAKSWALRQDEDTSKLATVVAKQNEPVLHRNLESTRNSELSSGEWIKSIVWDDTIPPERPLDIRLILNENDVHMNLKVQVSNVPRQGTVAVRHDLFSSWAGAEELGPEIKKLLQKDKSEMSIVERRKFASVQRTLNLRQQGLFNWQEDIEGNDNSDSDDVDEEGADGKANVQWELRLPKLRHSIPGNRFIGCKTELNPDEIRALHRPHHNYQPGSTYFILSPPPNVDVGVRESTAVGGVNGQVRSVRKQDLSTIDGKVILVEYSEKRPSFMSNFGMGSNIANFYQLRENPEPGYKGPQLEYGKTIVLRPGEKSPFMATIEPERIYTAITNKMYTAPLFQHKVNECDFLIVRPKDKRDSLFIRKIEQLFLVGQQEPNREVFTPNTYAKAGYTDFLHDYMAYHIIKRFTKSGRTTLHALHDMFPRVNSTYLRKVVKSVADRVKGVAGAGAQWEKISTAGSVEDYRKKVVPEDVCCYESVQSGLQNLYDAGVYRVCKENVTKVLQALQTLERQRLLSAQASEALSKGLTSRFPPPAEKSSTLQTSLTLPPKAQRFLNCARFVVDKLQLTPWHITSCFINIFRREGQVSNKFVGTKMRLTGIGDPSGRGEAISYLPEIEDDLTRKKRSKRGGRPSTKATNTNNTGYGGTDSDLRKLSMEGQAEVLRKIGYSRAKILSLGRWDRNLIIKNYASTKHGATAFGGMLAKYSRTANRTNNSTTPAEVVLTPYQKSINKIFERQLNALSDPEPPEAENTGDSAALNVNESSASVGGSQQSTTAGSNSTGSVVASTSNVQRSGTIPSGNAPGSAKPANSKANNDDEADELARLIEVYHKENAAKAATDAKTSGQTTGVGPNGSRLTVQEKAEEAELNRFKEFLKPEEEENDNASKPGASSNQGTSGSSEDCTVIPPPDWKPYQVLKRVLIKRLPNGETHAVVQYIKDPKRIKQHKEEMKVKRQKAKEEHELFVKQELGLRQSPEDLAEGMKLRDKQRAESRIAKSVAQGMARLKWYEDKLKTLGPDFVYSLPEEKTKKGPRCTVCRIKGHKSKSVKCPLYMRDVKKNKAVKQKGLRLSVNMGRVKKKVAEARREEMVELKRKMSQEVAQSGARLGRKRKKHQLEQEASLAAKAEKKNARGRAKGKTPRARLNRLFRDIVQNFQRNPDYSAFWAPVRKKQVPTYHLVVKKPMDLHTITKRTVSNTYNTRHELLADFEQILANSLLFNDHGKDADAMDLSLISTAAQRMLEEARSEFSLRDLEVGAIEAEVAGKLPSTVATSPTAANAAGSSTPGVVTGDIGAPTVSTLAGSGGGLLGSDNEQFGGMASSELLGGVYGDVGDFNLPAASPGASPGYQFNEEGNEESVWGAMANPFGAFNYSEGGDLAQPSPDAAGNEVFDELTKGVTALSPTQEPGNVEGNTTKDANDMAGGIGSVEQNNSDAMETEQDGDVGASAGGFDAAELVDDEYGALDEIDLENWSELGDDDMVMMEGEEEEEVLEEGAVG